MVSDAAKKRKQIRKKEKKRLNNQTLLQSKSQTNLSLFLDDNESSKEIGDKELEELLAEDNSFSGSSDEKSNELKSGSGKNDTLPNDSNSSSKHDSMSKYTFFNDDDDDDDDMKDNDNEIGEEDFFVEDDDLVFFNEIDDNMLEDQGNSNLNEEHSHVEEGNGLKEVKAEEQQQHEGSNASKDTSENLFATEERSLEHQNKEIPPDARFTDHGLVVNKADSFELSEEPLIHPYKQLPKVLNEMAPDYVSRVNGEAEFEKPVEALIETNQQQNEKTALEQHNEASMETKEEKHENLSGLVSNHSSSLNEDTLPEDDQSNIKSELPIETTAKSLSSALNHETINTDDSSNDIKLDVSDNDLLLTGLSQQEHVFENTQENSFAEYESPQLSTAIVEEPESEQLLLDDKEILEVLDDLNPNLPKEQVVGEVESQAIQADDFNLVDEKTQNINKFINKQEDHYTSPVLTNGDTSHDKLIDSTISIETPVAFTEREDNQKSDILKNDEEVFWKDLASSSDIPVSDFNLDGGKDINEDEHFFNGLSKDEEPKAVLCVDEYGNDNDAAINSTENDIEILDTKKIEQDAINHIDDASFFDQLSEIKIEKEHLQNENPSYQSNVNDENFTAKEPLECDDLITKNSGSQSNVFQNFVNSEKQEEVVSEEQGHSTNIKNNSENNSLLESDDASLLDSDDDDDKLPANDIIELSLKDNDGDNTVITTPLEKKIVVPNEEAVDKIDEFSFLDDDVELLDEDDDSLLESDEELLTDDEHSETKNVSQEIESHDDEIKTNKYAPTTSPSLNTTINASGPTKNHSVINPTFIRPQIVSTPAQGTISSQIIENDDSITNRAQNGIPLNKYNTLKQKTDAYDFPTDLVSNLKLPAKAKPIQTLASKKNVIGIPPASSISSSVAHQVPVKTTIPLNASNIPSNPYAAPKQFSSDVSKNPYAPSAVPVNHSIPSTIAVGPPQGIVKPGLNIVSQSEIIPSSKLPNNFVATTIDTSSNSASMANKAIKPTHIPASNTDLPFNIVPPKAIPRIRNNSNSKQQNTPPIQAAARTRAFSNVSSNSLSNNGTPFSPALQGTNMNESASIVSSTGNALSQVLGNQIQKSRTSSYTGNKPWGGSGATNPSIGNSNPYAPNFQHTRKNSNVSYSPINTNFTTQQQQPILSPTFPSLQKVGFSNLPGTSLNTVGANPVSKKVSHARSQSSVYAPNNSHGAGAKYAPIVHPSVQQAFYQQNQQFTPQFNQQIPQDTYKFGHSRSNSAYVPQQAANTGFVPTLQNQQQYMSNYQSNYQQQTPSQSNLISGTQGISTFDASRDIKQNQTFLPGQNFVSNPMSSQPFSNETMHQQSTEPYSNPETLLSRQFPIIQWASNGKIVSMKPSQYSGITNIKISSFKSYVEVPKYFIDLPGPLLRGRTKPKSIINWFTTTMESIIGDSAYDNNGKILWSLLMTKMELMEQKKSPDLHEFAVNLFDPIELKRFIQNSAFNQSHKPGLTTQLQMTAFKLDFEGLAQVLNFLRIGDHSKALSIALNNNDYSMAMVIASLMGKEKWTEVVDLYLKKEFQGSGPDSEFAVNLLSSIFQVYIGNGKSLVGDFSSHPSKAAWAVQNWNIILAAILSNSKSSSEPASSKALLVGFLVDFGVFLWKQKQLLPAHCCFILADIPLSDNYIDIESKAVFKEVGAPNSLDGMLLSELYEYSYSTSNLKFNGFITLLPSKITRSEILILQLEYTLASKYLDSCSQLNKELPKGSPLNIKFSYIIDKLKTQATEHNQSWIGKPKMSGVWGTLDKSFNKLIGGDDIGSLNEPIPKSESKLFDNYGITLSTNNSQLDLSNNTTFASTIGSRVPLNQSQQAFGVPVGSALFSEQAHQYQNNKDTLTKNSIAHLRNENPVNLPGPSSVSSIASSEHFTQQVASNLAKIHSHSRNQSAESVLSFVPNQQRLSKRSSNSSYVPKQLQSQNTISSTPDLSNTVSTTATQLQNVAEKDSLNQDMSTVQVDMANQNAVEHHSVNQLDLPLGSSAKSPRTASTRYSPQKLQTNSPKKFTASLSHQQPGLNNENQDSHQPYNDNDLFDETVEDGAYPVNSPLKQPGVPEFNQQSSTHPDASSNFSFPSKNESNSQATLTAYGPKIVKRQEEHNQEDLQRGGSDSSLQSSAGQQNMLVQSSLKENAGFNPIVNNKGNPSSLASPINTQFIDTNPQSPKLHNDFQPPSKPFTNLTNNRSPIYSPVTPQHQQSGGWTRTHSRSSSQILAEITGLNPNNNIQHQNGGIANGLGGSAYTSRNGSIDSNFAASEPVIRQIRSSSVIFTPESRRKPTEKFYYDDIVEEENEDELKQSKAEAAAIESKLAKARKEAEQKKQEERKKTEEAKVKDVESKKNDKEKEAGWFGWLKSNPNEKKPIKAKLGNKNQFYYDEKLKRWVNKNATDDEKKELEEAANTPPPPPPVIKKKSVQPESKPRSGSVLGGPTQRTMGVLPPRNPITGESLIPETEPDHASFNLSRNAPVVVQSVIEDANEDKSNLPPPSRAFSNKVNLTSSATGLDDLLSLSTTPSAVSSNATSDGRIGTPPAFGRVGSGVASASSRRSKRSNRGYVNVMEHL